MPDQITGERLASLFRPRSVALVGAAYRAVTEAAPQGARIEGVLVSPMRRGGTRIEALDAVVTWREHG